MTPPARSNASGKPGKSRKSARLSAGLILFRRRRGRGSALPLEVFLAHPGGPFWARRDDAAWTIPKGGVEEGEDLLDTARREFQEETGITPRGPFRDLGSIKQRAGKVVHAWAWEGDADPATVTSNDMRTEWPRGSGRWIVFPEVDRCCWFDPETARRKLNPAQAELIDRLEMSIADDPDGNQLIGVPDTTP